MNIGVIASLLEKDAKELANAHKIAEGVETLDESILENVLKTEIEDLKKSVKLSAKKEAFGFAERQVKFDIEKRLKSEFGIDGEQLEDLFESLKSKVQPKADDSKTAKELEFYKGKFENLKTEFDGFKKNVEVRERQNVIFSKLDSLLSDKFDLTGKEKLKKIAFSEFVNQFDFEILDSEIHLIDKVTKKPTFKNIEDVAIDYFKDIFPEKNIKSKVPHISGYDPSKKNNLPETKAGILMALKSEKDPTQREVLKKQLESLKE